MSKRKLCLLSAVLFSGMSASAFAGPEIYCNPYSQETANRKVGKVGTSDLADIAIRALTGESRAKTPLGAGKWRHAYEHAFEYCMQRYAGKLQASSIEIEKAATAIDDTLTPDDIQTDSVDLVKPSTKSAAWNEYCLSKHPTYNPKTGMYKTLKGKLRECR